MSNTLNPETHKLLHELVNRLTFDFNGKLTRKEETLRLERMTEDDKENLRNPDGSGSLAGALEASGWPGEPGYTPEEFLEKEISAIQYDEIHINLVDGLKKAQGFIRNLKSAEGSEFIKISDPVKLGTFQGVAAFDDGLAKPLYAILWVITGGNSQHSELTINQPAPTKITPIKMNPQIDPEYYDHLLPLVTQLSFEFGGKLTKEKKTIYLQRMSKDEEKNFKMPRSGVQTEAWQRTVTQEARNAFLEEQILAIQDEEIRIDLFDTSSEARYFVEGLTSGQLGDDRFRISEAIKLGTEKKPFYAIMWLVESGDPESSELRDNRYTETRFIRDVVNIEAEGTAIWINDKDGRTLLRISSKTPIQYVLANEPGDSEFIDLQTEEIVIVTNDPPNAPKTN